MMAIIWLAVVVAIIAGVWKTFVKANQPGWASIIPFYNMYIMLVIAGKPGWWILLMFIPIVNLIVGIIASIAFAQKFGKGAGFGIGLALLGFIFFPSGVSMSRKYPLLVGVVANNLSVKRWAGSHGLFHEAVEQQAT